MRSLVYMASRDKVDVNAFHKGIQYALEKLGKSKLGFERTAVSNFKRKRHEGSGNEIVDYSIAPCFGADQKACGLWERDGTSTNFKVAEHSFRARSCALMLMRFSTCSRIAKTNMPLIQRSFFVLNARSIFAIFLRNWTQCIDAFNLLWQRYVRKGNAAKNPAILGFFNIESSQLNAAHAQLLEKLRPIALAESCRFLTIQSLEFQEIWQKNRVFNNTENDLRRITKIAYVKILL